uniref:Uncharacterized protein n=1 Tax=Anguilla anguilla TaxID=7936 RepID=A0A0E9QJ28_ANGAN
MSLTCVDMVSLARPTEQSCVTSCLCHTVGSTYIVLW